MDEELLTAAEVAVVFRTTPKTVNKWARDGDIVAILLPGGNGLRVHRRFRRSDIERMLAGEPTDGEAVEAAAS